MQVLSRIKMEIRPNFGGGSPAFFGGGVSFFHKGGGPEFCKQGRFYPSVPPLHSYGFSGFSLFELSKHHCNYFILNGTLEEGQNLCWLRIGIRTGDLSMIVNCNT